MAEGLIIPTTPNDLERIKNAAKEYANCLVRIDAEKDEMKAISEMVKEDLEIPPKYFNKLAKIYHKQEFAKTVQEADDFAEFYEAVMK